MGTDPPGYIGWRAGTIKKNSVPSRSEHPYLVLKFQHMQFSHYYALDDILATVSMLAQRHGTKILKNMLLYYNVCSLKFFTYSL